MEFFDEIRQQPEALRRLVTHYTGRCMPALEKLADMLKERAYHQYIFTGMGSSYFVGYIAAFILRQQGIAASAFEAKEFLSSGKGIMDENTLLVLISQSGESKEVADICRSLDCSHDVAVVTNYSDSFLFTAGEVQLLIYAGEEQTTATKSYTNTIAAVIYMALLIADPDAKFQTDFASKVESAACLIEQWIHDDALVAQMVDFFSQSRYICLIGGNASYCSASHCELVVEEAGKMFSSRYLPAQFIHGPIELIDERFSVIAFDFSQETREEIDRVIENILDYGGRICVIGNRKPDRRHERLMYVFADFADERYAPLVEVVPVELLINALGKKRGLTPGVLTRVRK